MHTLAVSTIPGPDGLVHWKGYSLGIPLNIAEGILSFVVIPTCGISKLEKALKELEGSLTPSGISVPQFEFTLSLDELTAIFEEAFGMSGEEATSTAASLFWQLRD